jgi:MSHA type pilus biogenesis protein MshL
VIQKIDWTELMRTSNELTETPVRVTGRTWAPLLMAVTLAGCAAASPPRSVQSVAEPELEALRRMRDVVAAESKKLLENQDAVQQQMKRRVVVPQIQPIAPKFDALDGKFITVAMSKAPISQILVTFADSAQVNLVVDPAVLAGGLVSDMYLRDVSLKDAFREVLRAYDVSGEIESNTMRVTLYEERFMSLDFLNATTQLDMTSGGNVFGNNSAGANALRGNLSMSGSGGTKSDPYAEIEQGIKVILGERSRRSGADFAPAIPTPSAASSNPQATVASTAPMFEAVRGDALFTINKLTGTLYVKARPSKVRAVEKLIARAKSMLSKQVHIEAQLIDVQLADNFEFGVDWALLRNRLAGNFGATPLGLSPASDLLGNAGAMLRGRTITLPAQSIGSANGASAGIGYQGSTVGVVLNALRSFGTLRVLSNPNVQVRNGTPALLSVGTSSRYVARSSSSQTSPGGGASTVTSDVQTDSVFSGVMVGVLPFMREDGRVELLVNPMQSDVDANSLQLVNVNDTNRVSLPVVNYKGLTTMLNVADGDVVVIGGLIDQRASGSDRGAPGLSDVPLFGKLFGNQIDSHSSRELVVVLRVRVL